MDAVQATIDAWRRVFRALRISLPREAQVSEVTSTLQDAIRAEVRRELVTHVSGELEELRRELDGVRVELGRYREPLEYLHRALHPRVPTPDNGRQELEAAEVSE